MAKEVSGRELHRKTSKFHSRHHSSMSEMDSPSTVAARRHAELGEHDMLRMYLYLSTSEVHSLLVVTTTRHAELGESYIFRKYVEADPWLVNTESKSRHIPLHLACRNDHVATAEYLIQSGSNIEAQDTSFSTPLLIAVMYGHLKSVQLLISHSANVNAKNKNLETGLHLAAKRSFLYIVEALLKAGANPLKPDRDGRMPKDVVGEQREEETDLWSECNEEIVAMLEEAASRWQAKTVEAPSSEDAPWRARVAELEAQVQRLTKELDALRGSEGHAQSDGSTAQDTLTMP